MYHQKRIIHQLPILPDAFASQNLMNQQRFPHSNIRLTPQIFYINVNH
jgi:hypothetical protein